MKPITTILKNKKYAQLKVSIMYHVASNGLSKTQVHESTCLKGFTFKISRAKTIKVTEL